MSTFREFLTGLDLDTPDVEKSVSAMITAGYKTDKLVLLATRESMKEKGIDFEVIDFVLGYQKDHQQQQNDITIVDAATGETHSLYSSNKEPTAEDVQTSFKGEFLKDEKKATILHSETLTAGTYTLERPQQQLNAQWQQVNDNVTRALGAKTDHLTQPGNYFGSNGINFNNGVVLERSHLVESAMEYLFFDKRQFLVLGAPPAYGKTSLLQLLEKRCTEVGYHVVRFGINTVDPVAVQTMFRHHTGIDLAGSVILPNRPRPTVKKVIMLDEAHRLYEVDKEFWVPLIKHVPSWQYGDEYVFVFAVTDNLSLIGGGSPASFRDAAVARIGAEDLLLNQNEKAEIYEKYTHALGYGVWQTYDDLKRVVLSDSGGQVGVITNSLLFLENKARLSRNELKEKDLLRLLFSGEYLRSLERCFDIRKGRCNETVQRFLTEVFINGAKQISLRDDGTKEVLLQLCRGGVLKGEESLPGTMATFDFTTPVAKRLYYNYLFPDRSFAEARWKNPAELVLAAIATMSAAQLKDSALASTSNPQFPKEAAFQHLLMTGLATHLHVSCTITPEMSNSWDGDAVKGELDFFVNESYQWGIEVLKEGASIGEHLARFGPGGKYRNLQVDDYIVVDFRPMVNQRITNVARHEKRLAVFFSEEYKEARYILGKANVEQSLRLKN